MIVIPAIDLIDGKVVRLRQGDYGAKTEYSSDPVKVALRFAEAGASMAHLVDLDGARLGYPVNSDLIGQIVSSIGIPVEVGGGIRSIETVGEYMSVGASRVILGTAAIERPEFAMEAADLYPDRIWVGLDMKNGAPALRGWVATAEKIDPRALIERYENMGVAGFVHTDISRDGEMRGPDIEGLRRMVDSTDLPIIASGGISRLADLEAIMKISEDRIEGAIIGKALYVGAIDLAEAIELVEGRS